MLLGNGLGSNRNPVTSVGFHWTSHFRDESLPSRVGAFGKLSSIPSGYGYPHAIALPITAGAISSHKKAEGSSTATLTLISLKGTIAGTSTATGAINAVLAVEGTAPGSCTVTGTLTAKGNLFSSAAGVASNNVTLTAIGILQGISSTTEELSPSALATALWNAAAADYNQSGTMGEKLNDAGSASNPWTEIIESGFSAAEILRLIAAAVQGDATGLEDGNPTFKGLNGTTDRITATYTDGTRVVTDRNAS